jgi:hypothetical protein
MAAVLFVELPSANTEAAAGDRGGFFYERSGKSPHPAGPPLARLGALG